MIFTVNTKARRYHYNKAHTQCNSITIGHSKCDVADCVQTNI